jgi:phospholipase C
VRRWMPIAVVGTILLLVVSSWGLVQAASQSPQTTTFGQFQTHIKHIVFLMQENHAFDNIYGVYCPTTGTYCTTPVDGVPAGTCVPKSLTNPGKGCIVPYNLTGAQLQPPDLAHTWFSTHKAMNNGSMNGFYQAEGSTAWPFGHYNGSTTPVYWDLAEEYGLADNFFSSAASYSLPNHWFTVAASAPNSSYTVLTQSNKTSPAQLDLYLNQSNATPTIESELVKSNVSWDVYDFGLGSYNTSTKRVYNSPAFGYWNPLAARAQSYQPNVTTHFVPRTQFFSDAANGTLPSLSWLIPSVPDSDHPPYNISTGENWVATVVDALEKSPEWNSTALFVSWDEYGGFYDQVVPPVKDAYGDGLRVPLLAISPWVRQGSVDKAPMDFDSVLHLMEKTFGLKCLGPRDCRANLPLSMFNFKQKIRAPIQIASNGTAVYPMPLQSSGKLPYYGPGIGAPIRYQDPVVGTLPTNVDWS